MTAQLHPVKVLAGWEEEQGSRHTGGGDGMADKGAEGTGGRQAGRQVSRMQSGERGERVAGKKKKKLNTIKKKIHLDLLKTKPKRKTKKPKM